LSDPRTILLAGATGMVGVAVLERLLARTDQTRVLAPVRRPLPFQSPRLLAVVGEYGRATDEAGLLASLREAAPAVDALVCCLGTTLKKAGSREAFLAVDRDLVLRMAGAARSLGARHAVLVSSVGASAQSGNFYLRVKGEAERALSEMDFERVDLLRPGLLLGERAEARPGEAFARMLAPVANPLLLGTLRRYRGIAAHDVAAAAVALLGRHVHEHDALMTLAAERR
jgi:uncharacterized protein YbjT (DUF2867 family)